MQGRTILAVRQGKTIYQDGDRVLKVFDVHYKKENVLNEALNQSRMEGTAIRVPKVLEVKRIDGNWAIVSEFIKGKTLKALLEEHPADKDKYLHSFIDLQLLLNAQHVPLLTRLRDKMNMQIARAQLSATTRYALHAQLEKMPRHDKVCHGDFCPGNIIVGEDLTFYLLDWSHATQGNASADVAYTYLTLKARQSPHWAQAYLDQYYLKTGESAQHVQKWLPLVAACLSTKEEGERREALLSLVRAQYE